jgi:hypothetical protein
MIQFGTHFSSSIEWNRISYWILLCLWWVNGKYNKSQSLLSHQILDRSFEWFVEEIWSFKCQARLWVKKLSPCHSIFRITLADKKFSFESNQKPLITNLVSDFIYVYDLHYVTLPVPQVSEIIKKKPYYWLAPERFNQAFTSLYPLFYFWAKPFWSYIIPFYLILALNKWNYLRMIHKITQIALSQI